jgi:hypothetical protein
VLSVVMARQWNAVIGDSKALSGAVFPNSGSVRLRDFLSAAERVSFLP